VLKVQRA